MIFKRMICLFLLIPLLLSVFAVAEAAERGVSLSSDSSFFNQLDLNTAGMEKVKSAVSAGNYTTAKSELLQYYKEKFASYAPIPADSKDANRVFLAMHDTWSMSENRIAETTIKGTGFNFYSFGKTTNITGYYVLDILDRPDYAIQICTRENEDTSHRPVLKCYDASGKLISEVVASADAMIHKGKPDTSYGSDTVLYVKSGMTQNSDGTYLPYNINSRRVYMKFNVPTGTKHTELVIYARLHGAAGGDTNSLTLYQFDSFNKSWTESNLTWNYLVKLKAMGHYSWKDIPGGFDWKQPEGVSDYDWLDSNSRFYELVALAQTAVATTDATQRKAYFAKLKEILLDFINDTNVRTGFPANRDRETSSRMMNFPYIYKQLLAENVLNANENKKILAYVHDELTFMDNGATIFDNSGSNHGASAYTNHSVYHLGGFYAAVAYWPEFKSNAAWRKRYDSRVDFVLTTLINSDGSYNEVSFGYPRGVLEVNSYLIYCMQERNDTSATVKKYINASILLARYLMDCSYPNGRNPYWGQGSTSSAIRGHINTFLGYLGNKYDNDPNVKALRHFVSNAEGTPSDTVAQYTPVKIVTDRTGWSANDSMIFMNAKSAGYHGHRDALALLYYYGGRSLLTDTGTTSASSTHPHYHFQHSSTRSHNTIEIDGKAQTWQKLPSAGANMGDIAIAGNDSYSSISSWTKASNNNISTTNASGSTVTHSTDFTHYRHVSYLKELGEILFVSDKVVPGDSASHSYTQNWHSAPNSNPTIATDSYDTGRTNFSSGANLLIAQVDGSSTAGSLQTGYDSSASATTTKYFQYQKTGTGTVTYLTVLYPMTAGSTATVQPTKINMSGTSDATALATRVTVNDSSRPTVKNVYHYHSFESAPGTRSFDTYTTNGGTATLVQDGNNRIHFATLSKGSELRSGNTVILKAPITVTDLAVTLENGVLYVESSDSNADSVMITVNLSGQAVHEVYYNGTVAGFTQAADGTVTVRGQYPLIHFNGGDLLGNISQWITNGCSASIKNGTMTGSLTGADPYVKSGAAFAYSLQKGDVVEIRIKYNITSGTYSGLQFFWLTEDSPQYNGTNRLLHSATAYPQDEYVLVRLNIPDSSAGDVMTGLRVDPVGTGTTNIPTGTYTVDYIYVGPAQEAPSEHTQSLFFDFTNDRTAELRYTSSAYGDRNYDIGNWYGNLSRNSVAYFDGDALWYSVVDGQTSTYFQTSHTGSLTALSLSYTPKAEDWVQVRLRLENMQAVSGSEPTMKLSYIKNNVSGAINTADNTAIHGLATGLNGKYVVLSAPLTDSFRSATAINALRLTLTGITNVSGKTGRVYLDYIFIGKRTEMPDPVYTVTFKGADGSVLATATVTKGGTASYTGATPTKTKDNSYHYTFKGWDKTLTNITADTTVTAQFTPVAHSYTYAKLDNTNHKGTCSCGHTVTGVHSWNGGAVTTQPTCTATGVKTYTCNTCKGTKTASVAALGHNYTGYKVTTNPTISATGVLTGTCSRCSGTTTVTLPKLNTTEYTKSTTNAPTCTASGTDQYTWKTTTYGTFSFNVTTAAKGHTEVMDKAVAPTCTASGKTEGKHCSVCNVILMRQEAVAALGHSYDDGVITTYPTLTAKGVKTFTCKRGCGSAYTEQLAILYNELFFDFGNRTEDRVRYGNATYNFYNFDDKTTIRWKEGPQFESVAVDNANGVLILKSANADHTTLRFDSAVNSSNITDALHYVPVEAFVYQIRFKMTDFDTAGNPAVKLQFWSEGSVKGNTAAISIPKEYLTSGEFIVLTGVIPAEVRSLGYIQSVRGYFTNVQNAKNQQGTLTVDYIYVGTEENLPTPRYTATFRNADGTELAKVTVHKGEIPTYTKATPTKAADSANHYTFKGWDKALTGITADTTYTATYTATAHSYSYTTKDTTNHTATCACGYAKSEAHDYSYKATKNPTASAVGTLTGTCTKCSGTATVALPKLSTTDYTKTVTKAPTCTATGTDKYTWKVTTYGTFSFNVTTEAKGHTEVIDKAVAATCTTAGKTEGKHCSVCNAVLVKQETVAALGHSFTKKVTAPTCTAQGYTTYTCSRCSHSYKDNYVNAKGHTEVTDKAVAPTCTTAGKTEGKHCSVCNEVLAAQEVIPAKGHSYTYTVIDGQTHTVGCENCDLSKTAPHSYENSVCICGEKEIKEPVEDVTLKLNHSLNLASDISVNLVVPKTLLNGFDMTTVYVESTLETYEGNEKTGTQTIRMEPLDNGYFYYFTLDGLTAVQMNDRISSVLYGTKGGQPYYSPVDEYSIATYAYTQLNKTGIAETLKTLCADLLRYGSKAQIFKAYRTDNLADANMTEEHKAYLSDIETVTFGNTNQVLNDLPNAPITWAGKSLNLESKVALKFVFNMGSYTGTLSELSLRVSYTDAYGNEKTATVSDPEAYGQGTGAYVFTVDSLLAAELRAVVSAQIYVGSTPASCTLRYSPDTYGNNKTGTLLDLCKALFAYADSAKGYFAP